MSPYISRPYGKEVSHLAVDGLQEYRRRVIQMPIQNPGETRPVCFGESLERREQTRYVLHADVVFEWIDAEGFPHGGRGFTRDVGIKGMFIYSETQPSEKADVEVDVSLHSTAQEVSNLWLRAEGVVIRVDRATSPEGLHGFAVLSRSTKLHDGAPIEG